MPETIQVAPARLEQLDTVFEFLTPFFDREQLLVRTQEELQKLFRFAFVATRADAVVGFAAVEIYSKKLGEIQCLAVDERFRGHGVARRLVASCVSVAKQEGVLELMAISNADELFKRLGFDYSLPDQKKALFISPQDLD